MIIKTNSRRMRWVARLCRLVPPAVSGRLVTSLYPWDLGRRENAAFEARSSLGNVVLRYSHFDWIAASFALRGFMDWQNVVIANSICNHGDVIIDIGSNLGTEMLLYAKCVGSRGRVISFEPLPELYQLLKDMIELNHLKNVTLYQAAVGEVAGKLRFEVPTGDMSCGMGRLVEEGFKGESLIEVDTFVLDEMLANGGIPVPRLIVMDTEGAELFVLRGARKLLEAHRPYIILECNPGTLVPHGLTFHDLLRFLEPLGYSCWSISGRGLHPVTLESGERILENWLCIPSASREEAEQTARRFSRRLRMAGLLPLIKHINPAVVVSDD